MPNHPSEKSPLESYISADLPIKTKHDDRLNRGTFSEALARVIRGWRKKPSLVIGLFGDWGSGKSSIKNMVLESLNTDSQPLPIIEFSPWQVSGQDLLTERFFREIENALGKSPAPDADTLKKRVARWKVYSAYLSMAAIVANRWNAAVHPAASSHIQPVAAVASFALESAALIVKSGAGGIESEASLETMSLAELKVAVSEDLGQLDTPILIVLDDVDRLTKEEIRLTLQLVKANADFPNLIYLILAQRDIVIAALNEIAPNRGDIFLEKIVQVGFDVPTVDRKQLQDLLITGLEDLLANRSVRSRFDSKYWNAIFPELFQLFRNLRDINRFLGSLAFHIELFRSETTFEVNPVDLIALEALRVFENGLYKQLASEKAILTYEPRWFRENKREEDSQRYQVLLDIASANRRKSIEKIIAELFPPTASLSGSSWSGIDAAEQQWFTQLRVCSYQVFDRYFQFVTPQGDVSQSEIDALTNRMSDQKALNIIFESLVRRDLLDVMLTRLATLTESLPFDHASTFLAALFEIKPVNKLYGFLETPPEARIFAITYWYLRRVSENQRLRVLQDALEQTTGIGFATRTVEMLGRNPEPGERASLLGSETDRNALKESCLKRIREVLTDQYELEPHDFRMLRTWTEWDAIAAREWLSEYVKTRVHLVRFLSSAVQVSGDIPDAKRYLNLDVIDLMLPREELHTRIGELLNERLNDNEGGLVDMVNDAAKRALLR